MSVSRLDHEQPVTVMSPRTGEVLTIDSPTSDLAGFLADVREHKRLLDEQQNYVQAEILRRQDANANWTDHVKGFKVTGSSPAPTEEWDAAELRSRLLTLVDGGDLTIAAVDAAVQTVVSYKARKSGVNALRKLGGEPARIIDELVVETPKRRSVRVERA